jgi:outer membrane protein assembly factor BamA
MKTALPFLLCIGILLPAAAGHKRASTTKASPSAPNKLIALKVTGTSRYTDKEILTASGLQIGQNAADGDFKEAVQRLGNSGMFTNAAYSYSSSATGTKLEIQLADIDQSKLVPAEFENFVRLTDDELRATLQRRLPLFHQLLPLAGNLPEQVSETLQAILSERKLPGRVSYLRNADDKTGTLSAVNYRVEEVSIRIHSLEFPGASPEQVELLTTAARRVIGGEYSRPKFAAVAKFDLMPVYLQRGYLKAKFGPSDARIVSQPAPDPDATGPPEIEIDAIVPVTPGKLYSTSALDWKGNSAIPTSDVAALLHLPIGQPADAERLSRDLEKVEKLYRSHGYMMVQIRPDAQFDDDKSTVHYSLNVTEGALFKMGELEILGLDSQATARLRAAWSLHPGQPYNADYPKKFLDDTRQMVPRGVQWSISIHETVDKADKTVDVEIHFK